MIVPEVPCYFYMKASGEAAEFVTSLFAPEVMTDITEVMILSVEFDSDIEAVHLLDETLDTIQECLITAEPERIESFNPLYYPMTDLRDSMVLDVKTDNVEFLSMDGNVFMAKSSRIVNADQDNLVQGGVLFQNFQLPSYETLIEEPKRVC